MTLNELPQEKLEKKSNFSLDYELLDQGYGQKLERFGNNVVVRPELDTKGDYQNAEQWDTAGVVIEPKQTSFTVAKTRFFKEPWTSSFTCAVKGVEKTITFNLQSESSQHVGIFPEHAAQWSWIAHRVAAQIEKKGSCSILNLFGYTGAASLVAAAFGAEVCHIDSSSSALTQGKNNQVASGLEKAQIRWLKDDVITFLEKEIRRKSTYDAIIMDPPAFGRGPDGETFNMKFDLEKLLTLSAKVLSKQPVFLIVNEYPKNIDSEICETLLRTKFKNMQMSKQTLEITETNSKRRLICATAFLLVPVKK